MFEEAGAGNVNGYIDRVHRIGKTYFDKKSSDNVRALLLNLLHPVSHNNVPVKEKYER